MGHSIPAVAAIALIVQLADLSSYYFSCVCLCLQFSHTHKLHNNHPGLMCGGLHACRLAVDVWFL